MAQSADNKYSQASVLLEFWKDTRLRAVNAMPPSARRRNELREKTGEVSWFDVAREIVTVAYGSNDELFCERGVWRRTRKRNAPSAGALYPLEVLACVASHNADCGNFVFDPARGSFAKHESEPFAEEELPALDLTRSPDEVIEVLIVILARPWVSMKKYRERGYLYCHLEGGHVAANMALYADAMGGTTTVHLRFKRSQLASRLMLDDSCREPLAIVALTRPRQAIPTNASSAVPHEGPRGQLEAPVIEERTNWACLEEFTSFGAISPRPIDPTPAPSPVATTAEADPGAVEVPLKDAPEAPERTNDFRAMILRRYSAKGFRRDHSVDLSHLAALLTGLRMNIRFDSDMTSTTGIGLQVLAQNVRDLEDGAYAYQPYRGSLRRVRCARPGSSFDAACMRQPFVGDVAALVLLHAPIRTIIAERGYAGLAESHFYAGLLAERMYLTASRIGIGITCLGAFDEKELALLGSFSDGEEVIYAAAVGVPDHGALKEDKLGAAYSHGLDDRAATKP